MKIRGYLGFAIALSITAWTASPAFAKIDRFAEVVPGIYRGSHPENVADLDFLRDRGVRTILELRRHGVASIAWEKSEAERMGFAYERVGLDAFLPPTPGDVRRILAIMNDPTRYPLYIHCQLGRDRTGLVVGLYRRKIQGWSQNAAWKEMRKFGFNVFLLGLNGYFWTHGGGPDETHGGGPDEIPFQ